MVTRRLLALIVLTLFVGPLFLSCVAFAQAPDPVLRLEVSPRNGTVDDAFILSISVEGAGGDGSPALIGGDDFKLSLVGSDVEMIGSAHEQVFRLNYRYQLLPKRPGMLTTPGAELLYKGKRLTQTGIVVNVEPSRLPAEKRSDEVFLLQGVDRTELYVGEQAIMHLELYSTKDLYRPQFSDITFDDFWAEPLQREEPFQRTVESRRYWVLRSRRAIFPLTSGKLTLPSRVVKAGVITQKVVKFPAFGGFFNFQSIERVPEERELRSNSVDLTVKPLPPAPKNYENWGMATPVVGLTGFSGSLDRSAVKTGETATLTVQLLSTGNISGAREIPLAGSEKLRLYQDTPSSRLEERAGQIVSARTFKVSLVPLTPGIHNVPPIVLDFFDPRAKSYRRAELKGLRIVASGNALAQSKADASSSRTDTGASSSAGIPKIPEKEYPAEGLLTKLSSTLSLESLLMAILGAIVLVLVVRLVRKAPEDHTQPWVGTSEELEHTFTQLLRTKCSLSESAGYEAMRVAIRRTVKDESLAFELLEVVDRLEQAHGRPSEGLLKHLEALLPVLRGLP